MFGNTTGDVGAHVWRVWFVDAGQYTHDFDRNRFRQGRNLFAAGIAAGSVWRFYRRSRSVYQFLVLKQAYEGNNLSDLEASDQVSNTKLSNIVMRYVFNGVQFLLSETVSHRLMAQLTGTVCLYRDDATIDNSKFKVSGVLDGRV